MASHDLQPLQGRTIAVTRTRDQAESLCRFLRSAGAEVIEAPTIELGPLEDYVEVDDALQHLDRYQWLVLTSANGVDAVFDRIKAIGLDTGCLAQVKVAAIGSATARRLTEQGVRPALVPPEAVGESMSQALIERGVRGSRILLLVADIARSQLPDALQAAGAHCDSLAVYRTRRSAALPVGFVERLERGQIDWITLTSPSSFANLLSLLGPQCCERLHAVGLASIGPVTTQAIREAGYSVAAEGDPHDVPGLVSAIIDASTRD
ncbi:MAG: uroporphyrinogen-III synthase [Planctomycetes bacterium]|nr:uroporphyrinogen-III synthase [Planctomycetota bacterium]